MSKDEAIKKIKELANENDLFIFITDKESVEDFNNTVIDKNVWERSVKHMNEFGDFSEILETLGCADT